MLSNAQWRALHLYGRSFYQVRKEADSDLWGFMATLPQGVHRDALYNAVIATPFRWQVLGLAYFGTGAHDVRRAWCDVVTRNAIKAQREGLVPYMTKALDGARAQGKDSELLASVLVMRPYTRQRPSMRPVLQRHADILCLRQVDIDRLTRLK